MREAVEVQLDETLTPLVLDRQLQRLAKRIDYHHRRAVKAARSHTKRRKVRLHHLGIDIARIQRCPNLIN